MNSQAIEWNNQGVAHFLKEDWGQAAVYFEKAREADPSNPAVWNNLGLLAHQGRAYERAIDCFQQANQLDLKPIYIVNEGNAFAMLGQHVEAKSCYHKALDIDPSSDHALYSLAKLCMHLDEYEQSIPYLETLAKEHQKAAHFYELAVTYMQVGKLSEALQLLYSLAEKQPSAHILFQIGRAEFLSKNYGIAEKFFKRALAESPDHKSFRHYLALNYLAMGNVPEGLRQLDLLLKLYPEDYELLTEKGVVLCGINDLGGAVESLSKALEINPAFAKALHYRERALQNKQKRDNP